MLTPIRLFTNDALLCVTRHTQMVYEGLTNEGIGDPVMLTRSAWAGMQRWGAGLWSGDTTSDWRSLRASVPAGLSAQLST